MLDDRKLSGRLDYEDGTWVVTVLDGEAVVVRAEVGCGLPRTAAEAELEGLVRWHSGPRRRRGESFQRWFARHTEWELAAFGCRTKRPWEGARPDALVYFLRDDTGPIKIGTTGQLGARVTQLRRRFSASLRLVLTVPGSFQEERALHKRFAHLALGHEWFAPAAELLAFIEEAKQR